MVTLIYQVLGLIIQVIFLEYRFQMSMIYFIFKELEKEEEVEVKVA